MIATCIGDDLGQSTKPAQVAISEYYVFVTVIDGCDVPSGLFCTSNYARKLAGDLVRAADAMEARAAEVEGRAEQGRTAGQ